MPMPTTSGMRLNMFIDLFKPEEYLSTLKQKIKYTMLYLNSSSLYTESEE